jgi:hypothetical protein
MQRIWVIEKGSYSDYRVVGVYTTKAKAERVAEAINAGDNFDAATVAEWPLDPGFDAINQGRKPFSITMLRDGEVERINKVEVSYYNIGDKYSLWKRTEADAYKGKGIPDALSATVWARNEKHAIKIASEHRAQMIAGGKWK